MPLADTPAEHVQESQPVWVAGMAFTLYHGLQGSGTAAASLTLQLGTNGICKYPQALIEAPYCLPFGFWWQARVPRCWGIVLTILEQLDRTTNKTSTILFKDPDLCQHGNSKQVKHGTASRYMHAYTCAADFVAC